MSPTSARTSPTTRRPSSRRSTSSWANSSASWARAPESRALAAREEHARVEEDSTGGDEGRSLGLAEPGERASAGCHRHAREDEGVSEGTGADREEGDADDRRRAYRVRAEGGGPGRK